MKDSHANQPSSSSLLVGAGSGAPAGSAVGKRTPLEPPNNLPSRGCDCVLAGTSASLLDHPRLANESRNCVEAMLTSFRLVSARVLVLS